MTTAQELQADMRGNASVIREMRKIQASMPGRDQILTITTKELEEQIREAEQCGLSVCPSFKRLVAGEK